MAQGEHIEWEAWQLKYCEAVTLTIFKAFTTFTATLMPLRSGYPTVEAKPSPRRDFQSVLVRN